MHRENSVCIFVDSKGRKWKPWREIHSTLESTSNCILFLRKCWQSLWCFENTASMVWSLHVSCWHLQTFQWALDIKITKEAPDSNNADVSQYRHRNWQLQALSTSTRLVAYYDLCLDTEFWSLEVTSDTEPNRLPAYLSSFFLFNNSLLEEVWSPATSGHLRCRSLSGILSWMSSSCSCDTFGLAKCFPHFTAWSIVVAKNSKRQ